MSSSSAGPPTDNVPVQTVKLKVLYTFDTDQKDNHLARWPHSVNVPTDWVDEVTQIGVIDLRTCLETITTASPELTSKLEIDYTIYAYDYSEPGTPLVGQGMLSKALAAQDENADGDDEIMVTGKITRNLMGLFSKNNQETLEVKLRLTPVQANIVQRKRSSSISSQDGIQLPWSNFSQHNNGTGFASQQMPRPASPSNDTGFENAQNAANQGFRPRERSGSFVGDSFNSMNLSRPNSRPGTPTAIQNSYPSSRQAENMPSRPSSRAGMIQATHARRESFNSGYVSGDENGDEGPIRKRARTTKVDWPTKSNYNIERQPDSLRVVASTASSVRLHRPVPLNPLAAVQANASAEEPVRPPTPIPTSKTGKPRGRPRKIATSSLAHGAQARDLSPALDGSIQSEMPEMSLASPEDFRTRSVSSTPGNMPSSPPLMPERLPTVTSPALPPMMDHQDSGFMSGNLEELFGDDQIIQFDELMTKEQEQEMVRSFFPDPSAMPTGQFNTTFNQDNQHHDVTSNQSNPSSYLPPQQPMLAPPRPLSRAHSSFPAQRPTMLSPKLAPAPIPRARQIMEEQRVVRAILPQVPASDPVGRTLHRAHTWAPDMSDVPMSEAPSGHEMNYRGSKKKVGRAQNKARLDSCIANGEMPPFCDNCGAIETPAWRRAYARYFTCPWEDVQTSTERGACCYKEVLETNDDGSIKRFRGLKSERVATDKPDEWLQINLCNSCGLWFGKQKRPRPREKYETKESKKAKKRKRDRKGNKSSTRTRPNTNTRSDAPTPMTDDSSSADTPNTDAPDGEDPAGQTPENEPQLPPLPRNLRANSAEPAPRGLTRAQLEGPAQREVQSSPGQAHRLQKDLIEIDFTPKPVRRQLFHSPNKAEVYNDSVQTGMNAETTIPLPAFVRRSPRINKTIKHPGMPSEVVAAVQVTVDGKENMAPNVRFDDEIDDLFAIHDDDPIPPATPTPPRRSERLLFKTPSKTPQRQFAQDLSPNIDLSPSLRRGTEKKTPNPSMVALLGSAVKKHITDMTPFSRSMYEAMSDAHELGLVTPRNDGHSDQFNRSSKRNTPLRSTPRKNTTWDFADLPDLEPAHLVQEDVIDWDLPPFQLDEMLNNIGDVDINFNLDRPIPSSPPSDFSNFINTDDCDDVDELRGSAKLTETAQSPIDSISDYLDPSSSQVSVTTTGQVLRRSPRKH